MEQRTHATGADLDEAGRVGRCSFLEIDTADCRLLQELADVLEPHLESLIDRWHGFLLVQPETAELMARNSVHEHLRAVQTRYFRTLLRGPRDARYFQERLHIGFVHEKVGLEPAWYLGSYRKFASLVRQFLVAAGWEASRVLAWGESLEKVILLDADLALDAYFRAKNREVLEANAALRSVAEQLEIRNRELTRQYRHASEAARVKDEVLAKISHELRSPLHAVLGYADLLADGIEGPLTNAQQQSLQKIQRHAQRLCAMIDQLIDAARQRTSGANRLGPFNPAPVLRELIESTQAAADHKGLRFLVELPEPLPLLHGEVEGFALSLGHVLENAVKFTAAGCIGLRLEIVGDVARFLVEDTGPGCPQHPREAIFEPFYQADQGDRRAVSGLGMGLPLARQTFEGFGGNLTLVRTGPAGSLFAAEVPLAKGPPADE